VILKWSDFASANLIEIRDYLAKTSLSYAAQLSSRILQRSEDLSLFPLFGAEVPEYRRYGIRELYEHPYRILYVVDGDTIQILTVVHSARRLPIAPPITR